MIWQLNDVLTPAETGNILSVYTEHRFHCGSDSNRKKDVKKTLAFNYDDIDHKRCVETLMTPLHKGLENFFIRKSGQPYFVWYKTGGYYNWHLDAFPIAGIAPHYSYTVALNNPDEYEGGELVIRVGNTEHEFKPPKGSVILYNTGFWHKVNEVTAGDRKVAIGWAESYIKESAQRNNLIDLKDAIDNVVDDLNIDQLEKLEGALMNMIREMVERP